VPENVLKYTIKVDKQTRAVQDVKSELKSVEQQTGKIGTAATKTTGAFGNMGSIIKGLGVAALLAVVTRQAFKGSDALQQMASELLSMVSTITKALEPAFVVLARAVKGLSEVLTGLVKIVVNQVQGSLATVAALLRGDFKAAFEEAGKTISKSFNIALNSSVDALEGFSGQSQIIMKQTVDNMLSEMVRNLKDTKLKGAEKLAIIDENETKLMALLKQTGDYRQADNDTQMKLQENFLRVFATEREAAEREMLNQSAKNAQARLRLAQAIAKQTLADDAATTEEKLAALTEAFELENEVIDANAEQRFESDEAIAATKLEAKLRFQAALAAINDAEAESEETKAAKIKASQDAEFKQVQSFALAKMTSAADAASREFAISKNAGDAARAMAAQGVRDAANSAAKVILVKGAEATAKAFAAAGGFPLGIPAAGATAAVYTGLAAAVSAAGGAVAGKIAPPTGGGAIPPPLAAEAPLGGPAPVRIARAKQVRERREAVRAVTPAARIAPAATGVAPGAEVGGERITIIVQSLTGEVNQETLDKLEKALNKSKRGRG